MKPAKQKAPMTQIPICNKETTAPTLPAPPPQALHPQSFLALVAKYTLRDGIELDDHCLAGNKGDDSDTDTSDDNDKEMYT